MRFIRQTARQILRQLGYDISRCDPLRPGNDPFQDMARLLTKVTHPMIIDVGANVGQSVVRFQATFPGAVIHSFEPSPATFAQLKRRCEGKANVKVWNFGVGAETGSLPFFENTHSDMSSFLAPGPMAWGRVAQTTDVPVVTLDSFTAQEKIDRIQVLKSDTQGYDFEVFKGAERLFAEDRVDLIYYEVIVSNMYQSLTPFYDVFRYLNERGFSLVSFYDQHYQNGMLSWADVLFAAKRRVINDSVG